MTGPMNLPLLKTAYPLALSLSLSLLKLLYRDIYALSQILLDYIHSLITAEYVGARIMATVLSNLYL